MFHVIAGCEIFLKVGGSETMVSKWCSCYLAGNQRVTCLNPYLSTPPRNVRIWVLAIETLREE